VVHVRALALGRTRAYAYVLCLSQRCCSGYPPVDWLNKDDKSALTRELRNGARGHVSDEGARDLLRRDPWYPGQSAGVRAGKKIQSARSYKKPFNLQVLEGALLATCTHIHMYALQSVRVYVRMPTAMHENRQ